ncbi:MAG: hypothetical protein AB7I27_17095 [Bacteriovoracaceae bacterium]
MKTRVLNYGQFCLSLVFCLGVAACNKGDYYQKDYLQNPYQDPTANGPVDSGDQGGSDSDTDGNTQGGVDSGDDSGTTGSTTSGPSQDFPDNSNSNDGSTTGGSDGTVTDGGTTGGTDGSTSGGTTTDTPTDSTPPVQTYGDCNNGHGNDPDHIDDSNPTIGLESKCKREKFTQASKAKLDILWIVDNSRSMDDEQNALGVNFNSFIHNFIQKDVDFKMAITTTDTRAEYKGLMVNGSAAKLTSAAAKSNQDQFMNDFKNLIKVGTSGSSYEKGLEASEGFMQRYSASFLRPDAYLAVVIISDEEDQSAKSVSFYSDYLKSFKANSGLVKVYSIVDVTNSNIGSGITTGHERYAEASRNTAGLISDIRDDFANVLDSMGDSLINLMDSFALSNEPDVSTIKVYIDGILNTNFVYDASSQSIKFNAGFVPSAGSEIIVTYVKIK